MCDIKRATKNVNGRQSQKRKRKEMMNLENLGLMREREKDQAAEEKGQEISLNKRSESLLRLFPSE